eukprot:1105098-Pyramimonas_sp.AAC.1
MEAHEDIDKAIERSDLCGSLWSSASCRKGTSNGVGLSDVVLPLSASLESADWCMSQRCGIWAFAESVRGLFKV